jgi:general stress protein YciG
MATTHKTSHEDTSHHAKSDASHKDTDHSKVGAGKGKDPNNFANNREKASEAGKKGGHSSH